MSILDTLRSALTRSSSRSSGTALALGPPREDVRTPRPQPVKLDAATDAAIRQASKPTRGESSLTPLGRDYRQSFAGATPSTAAAQLKRIMVGDTQRWADWCSHMARTDEKLRSLIESMILGITASPIEIEAADDSPEALKAAEILTAAADRPGFRDALSTLLYADMVGWGVAEHDWRRVDGMWLSSPRQVAPRDVRFARDWDVEVRVWTDDDPPPDITPVDVGAGFYWASVRDSSPNRWMVHLPASIGEPPTLAGDLHTAVWPWVFKHWADIWHQTSLERFANPFIWGKHEPNAGGAAVDALYEGLTNLAGDQVAIFEALPDGSDPINVLDASGSQKSSPHIEAIRDYDARMAVAITGSTLAFGGGEVGGNRALAEQQVKSTVLPRLQARALRLVETLTAQWAAPHLRLNTALTGGTMAPMPSIRIKITQEERPEVDADTIDTGAATVDDVRRSAGLEAWGGEDGEAIAVRTPPAAPMGAMSAPTVDAAAADAVEVADAHGPFAGTAETTTGAASSTSQTSSFSRQTRVARLRVGSAPREN